MAETRISDAKRRLMEVLKVDGGSTAIELAKQLGLTDVAVRQHLLALEQNGLVIQERTTPEGRGRPAVRWSLTELAQGLFPDRHAELTVGLIEAARQAVGEAGLSRILEARGRQQVEAYRKRSPSQRAPLGQRVEALAKQRTAEGYMAETKAEGEDAYLLIEHHCPICEAARCCVGICDSELEVFQRTVGPDVVVERTEHLVRGDKRCVYRFRQV